MRNKISLSPNRSLQHPAASLFGNRAPQGSLSQLPRCRVLCPPTLICYAMLAAPLWRIKGRTRDLLLSWALEVRKIAEEELLALVEDTAETDDVIDDEGDTDEAD